MSELTRLIKSFSVYQCPKVCVYQCAIVKLDTDKHRLKCVRFRVF